jgi:hypothetical protein
VALRDSIQTASTRLGLDGLPVRLLRYVAMIAVGGPLTVVITAIIWYRPLSSTELLWAAMLLVLAGIAERFPLHLTHKTNINIAAGAFIVMVLLLPWWLPGVLALLAVGAAQTMRRPEPIEGAFNTGQSALYVTAGAACFAAVGDLALGPTVGTIGSLGAIVIASATMHLLNTMLVALAGALQLGANPLRVWWGTIALDLMPQVTLTALGTIAALLAIDQPLVLPFLALPAALVHHSVRQTIQLRVDTHEAAIPTPLGTHGASPPSRASSPSGWGSPPRRRTSSSRPGASTTSARPRSTRTSSRRKASSTTTSGSR